MSREEEVLRGLAGSIGTVLGVTGWFTIEQKETDHFAALTDEWDAMHNDPNWAKRSEWGGTIVHGFHVLSRTYSFLKEATDLPVVTTEHAHALNYGVDRVRFLNPLHVGRRARDVITLLGVEERKPGHFRVQTRHTVEIEGETEPFMIADTICMFALRQPAEPQT